MKASVNDERSASSVRIAPAIASKPSYKSPVNQAVAALNNLSAQFTLKKTRVRERLTNS